MRTTTFFTLLFLIIAKASYTQTNISGIVKDSKGNTLPFVNILINDSPKNGAITDIDGKFIIETSTEINHLTFSYVGFESLTIQAPFPSPFVVKMEALAYGIETITVIAGENPAHRIIKKVVKNRQLNDSEKMEAYACKTYNKMVFGYHLDTEGMKAYYLEKDTSKKMVKRLYQNYTKSHALFDKQDLMIIESVTKRHFKKPNDLHEEVLHNRISGTKKLPFTALATQAQPFSFYQEEVVIFDQSFLNPISKNSTKKYFFNLTDTLFQQQDTVFIISFEPKKGKNFNGLQGLLYINSNQYAIQNVIAKPLKKDHLINFEITQKYTWVNDQHWFPTQLLFEMETQPINVSFAGLKAYGRTYISEVNLQPDIDRKLFRQGEEVVVDPAVYTRNDSIWQLHRKEDLSTKEKRTYQVIDSIFEAKKLDRWISLIEFIGKERFSLGLVDVDIPKVINGNPFQGLRLGLGLATNEKVSNLFEIGGYATYGFRDKAWRYGGHIGILFDKYRDNRLDFIYRDDLFVPAEAKFLQRGDFISFSQRANLRDQLKLKAVRLQTFPIKYWRFNAGLSQEILTPLYDYLFFEEQSTTTRQFAELQFSARFAYNEKFVRIFGHRVNNTSNFPILELHYSKGFDGFLDGQWAYDKWLFSLTHTFRRKRLGKTSYRIEAGSVNQSIPFPKLFSSFGLGQGYRGGSLGISQGFETMQLYEFVSDRFVHLFFRQDFGTLLFKSKYFRPNIIMAHNLAYGSLKNPDLHRGLDFKTLEKGFFEVGLILENLIRVKYFNFAYIGLGGGIYYRYGPNQNDDLADNIAYGLKLGFTY